MSKSFNQSLQYTRNTLIDNIDHHTASRPFGIYHITEAKETTLALYRHCHTEAEVFLLTEGKLDFIIEESHYHMTAGDCIFIPPMLIHSALKNTDNFCRFSAIVFDMSIIDSNPDSPYLNAINSNKEQCVFVIENGSPAKKSITNAFSSLPTNDDYDMNSCELKIKGAILTIWQEFYNSCFSKIKSSSLKKELLNTLSYIQNHFSENITLKDLALSAGLSTGYLGHYFTSHMGLSPFAYINKVRIVNAGNLLTSTDKSVTEIAMLSGYDNLSHFNRSFRKIMGVTPSVYRRNQRQ